MELTRDEQNTLRRLQFKQKCTPAQWAEFERLESERAKCRNVWVCRKCKYSNNDSCELARMQRKLDEKVWTKRGR